MRDLSKESRCVEIGSELELYAVGFTVQEITLHHIILHVLQFCSVKFHYDIHEQIFY
jgi:hypothetical protein